MIRIYDPICNKYREVEGLAAVDYEHGKVVEFTVIGKTAKWKSCIPYDAFIKANGEAVLSKGG